jgi:hypothetical protein
MLRRAKRRGDPVAQMVKGRKKTKTGNVATYRDTRGRLETIPGTKPHPRAVAAKRHAKNKRSRAARKKNR